MAFVHSGKSGKSQDKASGMLSKTALGGGTRGQRVAGDIIPSQLGPPHSREMTSGFTIYRVSPSLSSDDHLFKLT